MAFAGVAWSLGGRRWPRVHSLSGVQEPMQVLCNSIGRTLTCRRHLVEEHEMVDHPRLSAQLHINPGRTQPVGILLGFVAQRVMLGGHDQRSR
jgi:hypothetical protein